MHRCKSETNETANMNNASKSMWARCFICKMLVNAVMNNYIEYVMSAKPPTNSRVIVTTGGTVIALLC